MTRSVAAGQENVEHNKVNRSLRIIVVGAIAALLASHVAPAHEQTPGTAQTSPIVIIGGTIHPVDSADICNGSLLFSDGRILAIGESQDIVVPADAVRVDATGKHVYPGLISAMSDIGLREIAAVSATSDANELGATNPNVRSWIAVNPDSELIPVARANGILSAMIAPIGESMQGQSAVMYLDGWTAKEMVIKAPAGLCIEWESMESSNPDDKVRVAASEKALRALDDLLDAAKRHDESGVKGTDLILESLIPVARGDYPIFVSADRRSAIESAVAYATSRGLKVVIYGGYNAAECAALLVQCKVPVIIPGTFRTPMFRKDPYDAAYTLPERLRKAGVKFCISGEASGYPGGATNLRNLPYHAAHGVAFGLPRPEALRSITLSAAEILGVAEQIGSLTVGKDATILITDGDIMQVKSNVVQAWIQGKPIDLGNRHRSLFEKYEAKYKDSR